MLLAIIAIRHVSTKNAYILLTICFVSVIAGECGCDGAAGSMTTDAMTTDDDTMTTQGASGPSSSAVAVAFHGVLSNKRQTSIIRETVIFESIVTDVGGLFVGSAFGQTANFVVPHSGLYAFQATSRANGAMATPLQLLVNGAVVMETGRSDVNILASYPLATNQAVLSLAQGDLVDLYITPKGFSLITGVFNQPSSPSDISFSAHLIAPL